MNSNSKNKYGNTDHDCGSREIITVGDITAAVIRKNIENMYLRVKEPDGRIEISAPVGLSEERIRSFILQRREWILRAQEKVTSRAKEKENQPVEAPFIEREKRQRLNRQIAGLIAHWAPLMHVAPAGFTIKKMKTRWGSCNVRTGHMNFNYALADRTPEEVEYVVVHELTHLLEASHNERFWALMEYYLPGAKEIRRKMRNEK